MPPPAPTLAFPQHAATGIPAMQVFSWNPSSEATSYRLQVSTSPTFGIGAMLCDTSEITGVVFLVTGLPYSTTCYWRVNAWNIGGTSPWSSIWSFTTMAASSVEEITGSTPTAYTLRQNFPNPFNPTTKIQFDIPQACTVTLKVFTLLGKEVATLVSEELGAGSYRVGWDARGVPSGVYLCRMFAGSFRGTEDHSAGSGQAYVETKKLVLIK